MTTTNLEQWLREDRSRSVQLWLQRPFDPLTGESTSDETQPDVYVVELVTNAHKFVAHSVSRFEDAISKALRQFREEEEARTRRQEAAQSNKGLVVVYDQDGVSHGVDERFLKSIKTAGVAKIHPPGTYWSKEESRYVQPKDPKWDIDTFVEAMSEDEDESP